MDFSSLKEVFDAFNKLKVLIIGDVMVDAYVWGRVNSISPEAPVPIVKVQKKENRLGGAGNVALNIQSLGATPMLCSVVGDDPAGKLFKELLEKSSLSAAGVITNKERVTTVKKRILSGSQQMLRVDYENIQNLNYREEHRLFEEIEKHMALADVVIFQDYDKGVLNKSLIYKIIALADKTQIPFVVDPKRKNFFNYEGAGLFKPNLKELQEGLNVKIDLENLETLSHAVNHLKEKLSLTSVLVTLSEKGIYIDNSSVKHHIPAYLRAIADVSGAGDTVVGIAALCLALKLPPKILAALSNLGGGLVCEHVGVVSVNKKDLYEEALKNNIFEKA